MTDIDDLLRDPRPDLPADSARWMTLLRLILAIEDKDAARYLMANLRTLRASGVTIKREKRRLKLVPLGPPLGIYDPGDWDHITQTVLAPYAAQLKLLLLRVAELTD